MASENSTFSTDIFGFWLYILTDCVLFASLFATYIVLAHPGSFGPSLSEHISLSYILIETFFLLSSNFTFGMAVLSLKNNKVDKTKKWLFVTFIMGLCFVIMELYEFFELSHHGFSWTTSANASAFYALVGTHGLHVSAGLLWIAVIICQFFIFGINNTLKKRMIYLGLFWNFLDIVWIFVFSIVYLIGSLQ